MILSDKDLKTKNEAIAMCVAAGKEIKGEYLTDDQQEKLKLLEVLNKAMKHHEANFYHHADRLRAALDSLKTIEMSRKELFGGGR